MKKYQAVVRCAGVRDISEGDRNRSLPLLFHVPAEQRRIAAEVGQQQRLFRRGGR